MNWLSKLKDNKSKYTNYRTIWIISWQLKSKFKIQIFSQFDFFSAPKFEVLKSSTIFKINCEELTTLPSKFMCLLCSL